MGELPREMTAWNKYGRRKSKNLDEEEVQDPNEKKTVSKGMSWTVKWNVTEKNKMKKRKRQPWFGRSYEIDDFRVAT